jgi:hypothetical protein
MGHRSCTHRALVHAVKYSTTRCRAGLSHGQGSQQFNYHSARGHPVRARGHPDVLLVGRDTAISVGRDVATPVMGGAFGVALVVGTLALFIGYILRNIGRVRRGCFTSFYGLPTLEFLRFLALLPSILPTMPAEALMSALGKFRFIGSRPRLCSWARYCGGLRISLSDGGNPAFRLHPHGRALVPRNAEIPVSGTPRKAERHCSSKLRALSIQSTSASGILNLSQSGDRPDRRPLSARPPGRPSLGPRRPTTD